MRSIERSFKKIQIRNPNLGTYPCLAQAVRGRKFSRTALVKAFKKLMPSEEYAKDETKGLVDHLELITSEAGEGRKLSENALIRHEKTTGYTI